MYYIFVTTIQLQGGEALGSKFEKAKARLKSMPKDYRYGEAKKLLMSLGYFEYNKGRTSGSRVAFVKDAEGFQHRIMLHKPHPGDEMREYAVKYRLEQLVL